MDVDEALAWARKRRAARGEPIPEPEEEVEEVLEPGDPAAAVLARRYAREAEPYVRQVREEVFGSPEPPFPDGADEWTRGYVIRAYDGRHTKADWAYKAAVEELVAATGFREPDVQAWILSGAEPSLRRLVLRVQERLIPGTLLRARRASLEINAPIAESEIRSAWRRHIRKVWEGPDAMAALDRRTRRGPQRPKAVHDELDRLVERMPLDKHTWQERADTWSEEHEKVSPDALRLRWTRLQEKLAALTPEEDTDG